jgi:hypothetical protein
MDYISIYKILARFIKKSKNFYNIHGPDQVVKN